MTKWEKAAASLGLDTTGKTPEQIRDMVIKVGDARETHGPGDGTPKDVATTMDPSDPRLEELKSISAQLAALAKSDRPKPEKDEQAERMLAELKTLQESVTRKIRFPVEASYRFAHLAGKSYNDMISLPTEIPMLKELQEAHDKVAFTDALMCTKKEKEYDRQNGFKGLKVYRDWEKIARDVSGEVKDLTDPMAAGTSGFGSQWVPTVFASQLLDTLYRMQLRIVPLFRTIQMPHSPYTFPVQTTKTIAEPDAETTLTPADMVGSDPSNPATAGMTLTAKKYKAKVSATQELQEESIVPILDFLRSEIATAMAEGEEKMVLNGESGTAANGGVGDYDIGTSDIESLVLGLRFFGIDCTATHNAGGDAMVKADLDAALRAGGKWFGRGDETVIILPWSAWWDLLQEPSTPIMDASKLGVGAPLVTGQVGAYLGKRIVTSEFARSTVTLNGYNEVAGANTFTTAIIANTTRFFWGARRGLVLEGVRDAMHDMNYLIARKRSAFQAIEAAGSTVEYCRVVRNILP